MNIMPRSYKIRTKLLINFAVLLGLFILSLTIYQFALQKVETGYERVLNEEHNVYDQALQVKELMLRCRNDEKGFRLDNDIDLATRVSQDIQAVLQKNSRLALFANHHGLLKIAKQAEIINMGAKNYANDFQKLFEAQERIGLTQDLGLRGEFRKIAHKLFDVHIREHALGPILNSIHRIQRCSRKNSPSSRNAIIHELNHLKKMIRTYRARPIYMNQLNDLFGKYSKSIQHYLDNGNLTDLNSIGTQLLETLNPIYVPNAQALLLQIRRHEKDYLLRGDQTYIDQTHKAVNLLISALQDNIKNKDDIFESAGYLQRYRQKFDELVDKKNRIKTLVGRLGATATVVEQAGDAIIQLSKQRGEKDASRIRQQSNIAVRNAIAVCIAALVIGLALSMLITNSITKPLQAILEGLAKMAAGDYSIRLKARKNDPSDTGTLARMFNLMAETINNNNWFSAGQNQLAEKLRDDKREKVLCRDILHFLTSYLNLPLGAIYLCQQDESLVLTGSYAHKGKLKPPEIIRGGEGILGEAAKGRKIIILEELPADYIQITSSLGKTAPRSLLAMPISWQGRIVAVIELASLQLFPKQQIEFLEQISEAIAIALMVSRQRTETLDLLQRTQQQAEELQTQQEELKTANEELDQQTQALLQSEEELKAQQEQLQVTNEELEEKAGSLSRYNKNILAINKKLDSARQEIEEKAEAINAASRYKSEFLANMSHELRTPLNSLLLLANNLAKNKKANLDNSQVESAEIIYNSGNDLLRLINDILDLSKIEAGHMDTATDRIGIRGFADWLITNFQHMAAAKGLDFQVTIESSLPQYLISDRQRLEQIMRNLTANAIKFTETGSVTIHFHRPATGLTFTAPDLAPETSLAVSVIDTGIGVPGKQQQVIFEAFKQADGGTSRKYGGTGLGLSISKKLSEMLGGEIHLISKSDKGATFTLYLPFKEVPQETVVLEAQQKELKPEAAPFTPRPRKVKDDRNQLEMDDKSILIIEDDLNFAKILQKLAQQKGFKCLMAQDGSEGLQLAEQHTPNAIILDIILPNINGWQVLDSLKNNPSLRHIPVHMMSGNEKASEAMKKGAIGFLTKPISEEKIQKAFVRMENAFSKQMKKLLIVEDDPIIALEIQNLIAADDITIKTAKSGKQVIAYLQNHQVDCLVLDIGLPDMTGFTLLSTLDDIESITLPAIIIYTSRELTREENDSLRKFTDTIIIRGVKSAERLLDETALFLHRVIKDMPAAKREMIANLYDQDSMFSEKKILLVDDDMRNAFALSKTLEERGMKISIANDGKHALELLAQDRYDLILMDIMMPVMDGYETMAKIRAKKGWQDLPIIALTAKAMPEDREKCIAAGANDYLAKPVDEGRLISMLRVWLYG